MKQKPETSGLKSIPLTEIDHAPFNPRKLRANDPKIAELAASIKHVGVLQPILVRPLDGRYQLLAGARRFEAAKLAGVMEIPAMVNELDDYTAMRICVTENLQRQDLTPLEEGRGVAALLKSGRSVINIADDIGKSIPWVYRRAKLVDLAPEVVKLVEDPKSEWSHAGAGHLEILARLPAERQKTLAKGSTWCVRRPAVELAQMLENEEHLLNAAPWAKDACKTCMKRTDVQPELFMDDTRPEAVRKNARCLDPKCWELKNDGHVQAELARLRNIHGDKLVVIGNYRHDGPIKPDYSEYDVEIVSKKTPGAVPAVKLTRDGAMNIAWCVPRKGVKAAADKMPSPEMRRKAWVIRYVEKALSAADCPIQTLKAMAAFAVMFGTNSRNPYVGDVTGIWEKTTALCNGDEDVIRDRLWKEVKPVLLARLRYLTVGECKSQYAEALLQADLLHLEPEDELLKKAAAEIPGGKPANADQTQPNRSKSVKGGAK